jgi:CheY-like chemotaxis protein
MHILIVEDNAVKARRVSDLISSSPFGSFSIEVANDVVQAKKAMLKLHFDAMILDLQLPVRTGGPLMKIGGRFLLEEILASDLYLRPRYILGVSEYPDAISLSEGVFSENLFGLLDSSRPENEWIPRLESFINHAASATQVRLNPRNPSGYSTDLVIICALHVPELEGLLKLSYDWSEVTGTSCNPTFQATIRNASGEHKIVAVSA